MNLIFGEKIDGLNYELRKGVYAVIINSTKDKIAVVRTTNGQYFLLGGGIENNESHTECLTREALEESGYEVSTGTYIGNSMRYFISSNREPMISDGYFYLAQLRNKLQEPIDDDHFLEWINVNEVEELLFHDHQVWAVKKGLEIPMLKE
ncbi:NUDIX hydrolase [Neobacillus massiliamazoniensis]|uniref:7,8-dihydro-8-oxoguanine-triphosphatase n=1 Tax=Neobacillus massiliamazoniensis TaxID=1499688 RepID=A0A0U1P537_9BACI|nr:NUDIX domain-containing protein [Neobacillus massiliamazoniensis]CRK85172.1 7,8-dihydro-8-oxoguanine-triphosphatase [Neobacillus massiliamazoniensis]